MRVGVVSYPGACDDRDALRAVSLLGAEPVRLWHGDAGLAGVDAVIIPGGFSYGDHLRPGALAALSPVMSAVREHAQAGRPVLGICNGFQVLTESHLLPGALMRNAELKFVCRPVTMTVEETQNVFTRKYSNGQNVTFPVAHGDGNYVADEETLDRLEGEGRVVFRYAPGHNPNGSARNIAGILSEKRNVLGLMPHPERVVDPLLGGGTDGRALFESLIETLS